MRRDASQKPYEARAVSALPRKSVDVRRDRSLISENRSAVADGISNTGASGINITVIVRIRPNPPGKPCIPISFDQKIVRNSADQDSP